MSKPIPLFKPKTMTDMLSKMGNLPPEVFSAPPPAQIDTATAEVVNTLFRELKSIFPAWRQAWPDTKSEDDAKRSWVKGLMAEGISHLEQIRFGVVNCRKLGTDFIPSIGKFVKMCQPTPEMLGIPSHVAAYNELIENLHPSRGGVRTWSHEAVRHAALQSEVGNFNDQDSAIGRDLFDRNYDITIRMIMNGEPLRDIAIGISHDSHKTEMQRAAELTERVAHAQVARMGISADGPTARLQLLARFGLKASARVAGESRHA
ncbi:Replication protein P [Pseudomonas gingeri]|uniref:replication protein P n=1 Tax=Pseudomonas gingeri TaxID=117681 RepID=UPI0015A48F1E|nr:replication protein P [Pseudomonas gingeri]NWA25490.1 Replication protein P [Pseudomonas gingeri]